MRQIWVGSILLSAAVTCSAASLGRHSGNAVIGRPLDIKVQTVVAPDEDASALCMQADVFFGDNQLSTGSVRTSMQRNAPDATLSIRIQTTVLVNEPVVSVVVKAGCRAPFSRRYVLLADPGIQQPVAGDTSQSSEVASTDAMNPSTLPALSSRQTGSRTGGGESPAPNGTRKTDGSVGSAASGRPVSVVKKAAQPPKESGPRLHLDPVDLTLPIERDPTLRLSFSMLSEPTGSEQERAAAAQLWKAINASPEDILRDNQKLSVLEAEAKGLREQEAKNKTALVAMEKELEQAKYFTWLSYLLGALLLLATLGLVFLWRRRSVAEGSASRDWWASKEKEAAARSQRAAARPSSGGSPRARNLDIDLDFAGESGLDDFKPLAVHIDTDGVGGADRRDAPTALGGGRSVATEELFDVQQQSDFFVSLGEFDQAIGVLKSHIHESQEPSALAYLDLFKLYHQLGRRDDYERLREAFNEQFNAGAPPFDEYTGESRGLEAYETAFGRIKALWPQPKVIDLIEESIFRDTSDTDAEVFDLEAYRELLLLHAVAKEIVKRDAVQSGATDFQETAIRPLKAASTRPEDFAASSRVTLPLEELPRASPHLGLDVDLDVLQEASAFEASLPEVEKPVEASAKPAPAPGAVPAEVLPEGNLIDFEVLDFVPPDEPGGESGRTDK